MARPVTTPRRGRPDSRRPAQRTTRPPARTRPKIQAPSGPRFGPTKGIVAVRLFAGLPFIVAVALIAVGASGVLGTGGTVALVVVGVVAALIGLVNGALGSSRRVLSALPGRVAQSSTDSRLINLVDGLCFAFGLPLPRLLVVDSVAPNAIALGRTPQTTTLVITTGALSLLDRIELEGLLAHELAHVRRGDTARASLVTRSIGVAVLLSERAGALGARLAGPDRESLADFAAITVTRYPPALADALEALSGAPSVCPSGLSPLVVRLTSWQWCAPLESVDTEHRRAGQLDLDERIAALREL